MTLSIDAIFALVERFGDRRYGEDVTQLGHALQCAQLAREDGADDALIAAALLHDIGQFLDGAGEAAEREARDARHEVNGAQLLEVAFPDAVTEPIRLHVQAKRYLCAVEPGYAQALSAASALSLRYQGGPMTPEQRELFEREPHWRAAVRLRRYDDRGKNPDRAPPPLETYRPLLASMMRAKEATSA